MTVADRPGGQPLDAGIAMLEDGSGSLELGEVRAAPGKDWKRPAQLPVSLGYSRSVWWLHLRLRNDGAAPVERVFEMGSTLQDYIDLAVVRGDGQVDRFPTLGDRVPFSNRPLSSVSPAVMLKFAPHETLDLYLRLSTHDGLFETLPLTLWTNRDFERAAHRHWYGSGAFSGLFGLLLVSTLLMYFATRRIEFATYLVYLLATVTWRTVFAGDALLLLWPEHPALNNRMLAVAAGGWMASGSVFLCQHMRLHELMPRMDRLIKGFAAGSALVAILSMFDVYSLAFALYLALALVVPLAFACSAVLLWRGERRALWMLISWAPLLACPALYAVQLTGASALDWLPPMTIMVQIALAAQMVLKVGALADDLGAWSRSVLAAERAARRSQEKLAATLEDQVQQRTRALESANAQLRELTITDALTGVFNRRHFNESLEVELARLHRQGETAALCMLDIDHFKLYNDQYGHPKGDKVLQAVASELERHMRRAGDRVFRVGGEEFALLLLPGEFAQQQCFVESLRAAIQSLRIPHAGNAGFGVVTASFGLVQMPPADPSGQRLNASALYREADRLLYQAKKSGRNQVACEQRPRQEWAPNTDFVPDAAESTRA